MSYKLRISEKAHNDIYNIYRYVLKDGEEIAKKQAHVIYDALKSLEMFPNMGANLSSRVTQKTDYKFLTIKKVYVAFYKIVGDEVRVIRVFRGEQDYLRELGIE